jgi:hypothetical protein
MINQFINNQNETFATQGSYQWVVWDELNIHQDNLFFKIWAIDGISNLQVQGESGLFSIGEACSPSERIIAYNPSTGEPIHCGDAEASGVSYGHRVCSMEVLTLNENDNISIGSELNMIISARLDLDHDVDRCIWNSFFSTVELDGVLYPAEVMGSVDIIDMNTGYVLAMDGAVDPQFPEIVPGVLYRASATDPSIYSAWIGHIVSMPSNIDNIYIRFSSMGHSAVDQLLMPINIVQ